MKQRTLNFSIYPSRNIGGGPSVCICLGKYPMTVAQMMAQDVQWRIKWDGPHGPAPVLSAFWGWDPLPFHGTAPIRTRTTSKGSVRVLFTLWAKDYHKQLGKMQLPTGRWTGTISVDPDEIVPHTVALQASPVLYIARPQPAELGRPERTHRSPLPNLELP